MSLDVIIIPADLNEPIRLEQAPDDDGGPNDNFAFWCRKKIDGYLEMHRPRSFPRSGIIFWIDEDAKVKQRPLNLRATCVALLAPFDHIAGDAVVTGSKGPVTASCPLDLESFELMVNEMMRSSGAE